MPNKFTYLEYLQWAHDDDSLKETLDSEYWREQD